MVFLMSNKNIRFTAVGYKYQLIILSIFMYLPLLGHSNTITYILHGYGSNTLLMTSIADYLDENGFKTKKWGYRSISHDIPDISKTLFVELSGYSPQSDTINFVTHSMGALIVRGLFSVLPSDSPFVCMKRVVMIAPPNNGAEITDFFSSIPVIRNLMGRNLTFMRTDSAALVHTLPKKLNTQIGTIAGVQFSKFLFQKDSTVPNDGYLSLENAVLGTENDFLLVPDNHLFILHNHFVKKNTLHFLRTGTFLFSHKKMIPTKNKPV